MQFLKNFSKHFYSISLVLALASPMFLFTAAPVMAQDGAACACYCGDSTNGAVNLAASSDPTSCAKLCIGKHLAYLGCYVGVEALPENDSKCWTQDECSHYATDSLGNPVVGTWSGQNDKCAKTKSGNATGYCYAPERGVKLNVPVLGNTEVKGFHEYLALAYRFLLPAMSLIAVVMIMVGGLEYVVSGGNAKRVDKAKHRITNAVIGLVLLLSAYTIASLLDPRLVNLQALRTPLIKRAVLLDPKTTCEALRDYGFTVTPVSGTCGQKGVIQSVENVKPVASNSNFKVGDSCDFSRCAESGKSCVTTATGNKCLSCDDISSGGTGVVASQYICGQVATQADAADPNDTHKYSCFFDNYTVTANQCVEIASPGSHYINCPLVLSQAVTNLASGGDPCSAYEALNVIPAAPTSLSVTFPYSNMYNQIKTQCESDPCKVGHLGGLNGCQFVAGSTLSAIAGVVNPSNFVTGVNVLNTCTGKK